jgi:hypothetical protein
VVPTGKPAVGVNVREPLVIGVPPVAAEYQSTVVPVAVVTVSVGNGVPTQTVGGVPENTGGATVGQLQVGGIVKVALLQHWSLMPVALIVTGNAVIGISLTTKFGAFPVTVPAVVVIVVPSVVAVTEKVVPGIDVQTGAPTVSSGFGSTLMLNVRGWLGQLFTLAMTVIVAVWRVVTFAVLKKGILLLPEAAKPIVVLLFVQLMAPPPGVELSTIGPMLLPLHTVVSRTGLTTGTALTCTTIGVLGLTQRVVVFTAST